MSEQLEQLARETAKKVYANGTYSQDGLKHKIFEALTTATADLRTTIEQLRVWDEQWDLALSEHSEYEGDEAPWNTMRNEFTRRDTEISDLRREVERLKDDNLKWQVDVETSNGALAAIKASVARLQELNGDYSLDHIHSSWIEMRDENDRLRSALVKINDFSVYAEPLGAALEMQGIAAAALKPA